ncbi:hypothetical protein SK128_018693, partial [Halocaridina rubra]
ILFCFFQNDIDEKTMHALRKAFATVDKTKSGFVDIKDIEGIFNNMGTAFDVDDLNETIRRVDIDKEGKINFEKFVIIASNFLQDDDDETITNELREAFRMYDKEGESPPLAILLTLANLSFTIMIKIMEDR